MLQIRPKNVVQKSLAPFLSSICHIHTDQHFFDVFSGSLGVLKRVTPILFRQFVFVIFNFSAIICFLHFVSIICFQPICSQEMSSSAICSKEICSQVICSREMWTLATCSQEICFPNNLLPDKIVVFEQFFTFYSF